MEIKINKLYGIENEINFNFLNRACIFAPNGVGKTSLYKGFEGFSNRSFSNSMEGEVSENSILIDGHSISSHKLKILLINEKKLSEAIYGANDAIREFLKTTDIESAYLPGNVYGDFFDTYKDSIYELEDRGIDAKEFYINFDFESTNSLNEINRILDSKEKLEKDSIVEYATEIKLLEKDLIFLKESNSNKSIEDYNKFGKAFNEIKDKAFSQFIDQDFEILSAIKKYNRFDVFKYKYNENFINSKLAFDKVNQEFQKNGFSEEKIKSYETYEKYKVIFNRRASKTLTPIIKALDDKIKKLKKESLFLSLKKNKINFMEAESEIKEIEKKFVAEYNKDIKILNNKFLKTDLLKWKIRIKPINNYHDPTRVEILNEDNIVEDDKILTEYASTGQQRIIYLLLSILNTRKFDIIIFDDVINSMDSDNVSIFINAINNLDTKFIILTHNYLLLSSLMRLNELNTFIMDRNKNEIIITEINKTEPLFIKSWPESNVSNDENKILLASTIIREVIDNYLNKSLEKNPMKSNAYNEIVLLKNYIENTFRHFKTEKTTFSQASKFLKQNTSNNIKGLFEENMWLNILMNSESDQIISDYVLNYKISNEFLSLVDYISSKYVLGLKVRFEFEKKVINQFGKENSWNRGDIKGIMNHPGHKEMPKNLIELNSNVLMLNHLNNLRWTPIVETPIYKINKYIEIITK